MDLNNPGMKMPIRLVNCTYNTILVVVAMKLSLNIVCYICILYIEVVKDVIQEDG